MKKALITGVTGQDGSYLDSGRFLWNSGMFLFTADRYLQELTQFAQEIVAACRKAVAGAQADLTFLRVDKAAFEACPADSIDYAVMEKTADAAVVALDAGWSDVGCWSALWDLSAKDAAGNAVLGDVILQDCAGSYVHASNRLVAAVGISDLIVIETKDAVLVASKDRVQEVKQVVERLKADGRPEHDKHREVYRPWGIYDSIENGVRYQVKRITCQTVGADAPHPRRTLDRRQRHRPDHQRRADLLADGEPVHLHSGRRTARPGKPGQDSARTDRGAVGLLPGRRRHRQAGRPLWPDMKTPTARRRSYIMLKRIHPAKLAGAVAPPFQNISV